MKVKVRYSYLNQQFSNADDLWKDLKKFVSTGDFTLGKPLGVFEKKFAKLIGSKYAIGVNSGTDALKLSLKAIGVGVGDEVITSANTFVATVGAINEIGAIPVFVDCEDNFCIDSNKIEKKITKKTKAIIPVHFAGFMPNMNKIKQISLKYKIPIIEDACQSILGSYDGVNAGTWGITGAFSLHPLKNINVWSDGGLITTNNKKIYDHLKLLRNHGLKDRDNVEILGYNSRLDTFQSVVGNWLLPQAKKIASKRIEHANYLDSGLKINKNITIPPRHKINRSVYHLYMVFAKNRNKLLKYCLDKGIEAKVHYPIPMYLQKGCNFLGHKKGDFPVTDFHAKNLISFPCDQHLSIEQLNYTIKIVNNFYKNN
jgi:dTDP-3-amino-2,3,6-trideoxy-4-keto-D-glucose/dTDP-3-amino-3,4,6-trideoxy-alpha-D-glucose/dTDP-2,6-dideoxy-D-kanosamine transaminase